MPTLHSHKITHSLFVFDGVRECFAFAKSHQPTRKPKLGKEWACSNPQPTENQDERRTPNTQHRIGNRRAERLRINGTAKFSFCSSYQR